MSTPSVLMCVHAGKNEYEKKPTLLCVYLYSYFTYLKRRKMFILSLDFPTCYSCFLLEAFHLNRFDQQLSSMYAAAVPSVIFRLKSIALDDEELSSDGE
jgi:hypothetical protein